MTTRARRVRIDDVARAAGVSITTVSHALSGKGRLAAARRQHVRAVAEALGYSPDPAARSLATGKTGLMAIVVSAPGNVAIPFTEIDYYVRLINAATARAIECGYGVVLAPSTSDGHSWGRVPLDGVIVIDPAKDDTAVRTLRQRGVPMVFVGRDPAGDASDLVVENDRRRATRTVLDHLAGAGAAHVGVLTLRTFESFTEDCLEEYRAWCSGRGATPIVHAAPFDATAGTNAFRSAAGRFLDLPARPTGVFCLYERLAVEVLSAARARGVEVPGELMIATIDEMGLGETTQPSLTELEINQDLLGRAAAGLLVDRLEGRPTRSIRDIATHLVPRGSSRP